MKTLVITLTRDGRPLSDAEVIFEGEIEARSDAAGVVSVSLPTGRVQGHVVSGDGSKHEFVVVNAQGLRRVRVAVTGSMAPLDDEGARASMPSDRYEPLAWLGAGAMGRVLKARDTSLDRLVAVKVLPAEVAPSPDDRERFISEGRSLARVAHPNLLSVYDVGINGAVPYLVVEYIDGPDLLGLVDATGPLPISAACAAGAQLCSALDALHQAGLVHRDVKPANGLVDTNGRVVLADFGLVRPLDDVADPRSKVIGTPGFMSPEHMQGQPLGPATDVYALGATLFNVIAGEIPLAGPALLVNHLTAKRPDVRDLRPDAPPALAELIVAMMAIDPTERPSSAEARAALESIGAGFEDDVLGPFMPRLGQPSSASSGLFATSGNWVGAAGEANNSAGRTTPGPPIGSVVAELTAPPNAATPRPAELSAPPVQPVSASTVETVAFEPVKRRRGMLAAVIAAVAAASVALLLVATAERPDETPNPQTGASEASEEAEIPPEPTRAENEPDQPAPTPVAPDEPENPTQASAPTPAVEQPELRGDSDDSSGDAVDTPRAEQSADSATEDSDTERSAGRSDSSRDEDRLVPEPEEADSQTEEADSDEDRSDSEQELAVADGEEDPGQPEDQANDEESDNRPDAEASTDDAAPGETDEWNGPSVAAIDKPEAEEPEPAEEPSVAEEPPMDTAALDPQPTEPEDAEEPSDEETDQAAVPAPTPEPQPEPEPEPVRPPVGF